MVDDVHACKVTYGSRKSSSGKIEPSPIGDDVSAPALYKGPAMADDDTPTDREIREQIAARLTRARKARGLLQKEVAAGCGVSESVQSRYENGLMAPRWSYLYRVEKVFGIKVSYLVTGSTAGMRQDLKNRLKSP